jgi:hypothetical protein
MRGSYPAKFSTAAVENLLLTLCKIFRRGLQALAEACCSKFAHPGNLFPFSVFIKADSKYLSQAAAQQKRAQPSAKPLVVNRCVSGKCF